MPALTPNQAWDALAAGHARTLADAPTHPRQDRAHRARLAAGQSPFASVLGCSDSRATPELIFDAGYGDLFMVRTAGHVVDDATLGSLEYGVAALGTPLLVVLGHTSCGAVTAAREAVLGGPEQPGHIGAVIARLLPIVEAGQAGGVSEVDDLVTLSVRAALEELPRRSSLIGDAVADGSLGIVGATYSLAEGSLTIAGTLGDPNLSSTT